MTYYLKLFVFLSLFISQACNSKSQYDYSNKQEFIGLLNEGYALKTRHFRQPAIIGLSLARAKVTCVYGKIPNILTRNRIDAFYLLIVREFKELSMPVYVAELNKCPKNASIFILIHESLPNPIEGLLRNDSEISNYLGAKGVKVKSNHHFFYDGLAGITRMGGGSKGYVYIRINQLSKLINNNDIYKQLLNDIITEELFQAVSYGRDINLIKKHKNRNSILQEPRRNEFLVKPPSDFSKEHLRNKEFIPFFKSMKDKRPTGLCSFDLWFLVLADIAREKKIIFYAKYVKLFNENFEKIKKRAQEIENNPAYKDLFDPRCSGKNTGINSKIGIE